RDRRNGQPCPWSGITDRSPQKGGRHYRTRGIVETILVLAFHNGSFVSTRNLDVAERSYADRASRRDESRSCQYQIKCHELSGIAGDIDGRRGGNGKSKRSRLRSRTYRVRETASNRNAP